MTDGELKVVRDFTDAGIATPAEVVGRLLERLEKAEANQITPTLEAIEDEIIRRAGKEWALGGHDFTVTITAEEYRQLAKERGFEP